MVDIDEWGQVIIVNMLTRYGRTQFVNPVKNVRKLNLPFGLKNKNYSQLYNYYIVLYNNNIM